MGMDRRTFLQQAGLGLLTLAIGDMGLSSMVNSRWLSRYYSSLAQPTGRKLALLVGINQYPQIGLNGCVTDVELQRELLIYRFGFLAADILILTDAEATRENIETAFVEHLTAQGKPGDVVVFHFSGYGSKVKTGKTLVNSLVPIDGIDANKNKPVQNPLMLETLTLLGRSLATDKVTMVLDTSYDNTDRLLEGNLRVRSCPHPLAELPNAQELSFMAQQRQLARQDKHPGIILAATSNNGIATEAQWNGFSAGLFTSALTQYLWQGTAATTVQKTWTRTTEVVSQEIGQDQQPQLTGADEQVLWPYYLPLNLETSAEGIITGVENDTVELHLTGLSAPLLSNYGLNSCFSLSSSQNPVQLQIWSREGLLAKARLLNRENSSSAVEAGQLVQETIRILPRNLSLSVALDSDLSRIERVDATSALSSIPFVSSLIVASDGVADCLFGRVKEEVTDNGLQNKGGYRLYSISGVPIPNTAGIPYEAVKSAIERLRSQLETLLFVKLLHLTVNEGSSRLGVKVTLERIQQQEIEPIIRRVTERSLGPCQPEELADDFFAANSSTPLPCLRTGNGIQYRVENCSDGPIYILELRLNQNSNPISLYLPQGDNYPIAPGQTLIFPQADSSFSWLVNQPVSLAEIQIICSRSPFKNTMEVLNSLGYFFGERKEPFKLSHPIPIAKALLQDLHDGSNVSSEIAGSPFDVYALDVNSWATLSFFYQVD